VGAESGNEAGGAAPDAPPRRETAASSAPLTLIGPDLDRPADCEAVLRSLPRWFGIEEALLMYVRDSAAMPTFAIEQAGRLRAFVTLHRHFPQAWEVRFYAALGYTPLEVFPTLWSPRNPALQLIKVLQPVQP
jgi:hypothetical protein